ncbi:protein TolR [Candidatus Dependentiae bacterium Noda2021]|nr:protein TolR [Candidatus Dependentiae bacterium Noda2021]
MARNRRKRKSGTLIPEVTLTPLIDTALTLLIIFMVTSPMLNNSIKIDLPKGKVQEDKGTQQELIVFIDKQEKIFLNGTAVSKAQLNEQLKQKLAAQPKPVIIKGDRNVGYGYIFEIVDEVKLIPGVSHVALASQKAA